jgi:hypothetical protein
VGAIVGLGGEAVGLKPPQSQFRILLWYHHVALEAAFGLEAQAEATFHIYYFVGADDLMKPKVPSGLLECGPTWAPTPSSGV